MSEQKLWVLIRKYTIRTFSTLLLEWPTFSTLTLEVSITGLWSISLK